MRRRSRSLKTAATRASLRAALGAWVLACGCGSGAEGGHRQGANETTGGAAAIPASGQTGAQGGDGAACPGCGGQGTAGQPGGGSGTGAGGADAGGGSVSPAGPGHWRSYGFDLANTQVNPDETRLDAKSLASIEEKWRIAVGRAATSRPMTHDGMVYFGAWDATLYAVDADSGSIAWKQKLGVKFIRSSLLVTDDTVYAAADGTLHARRRSDGSERWNTVLDTHPEVMLDSSPIIADGILIIGVASYELGTLKADYTFEGSVVGLDAQTGAELWRVPVTGNHDGPCIGGGGVSVWSTAAVDTALGLAFIGTGQTYEPPASACGDSLLAIHYAREYAGERIAWTHTFTANDVYTSAANVGADEDVGAAPNLFEAGGKALVGVGGKNGSYRVFERATGTEVWRADLDRGIGAQLGGVMATAAVHEGTVFVASNRWSAWSFSKDGTHNPADVSTLYALDASDGSERWKTSLPAPVFGSFAVANGLLYHPTISGTLYARDIVTGAAVWSHDFGRSLGAGPSISGGSLYQSAGFLIHGPADQGVVVGLGVEGGGAVIDAGVEDRPPLSDAQCLDRIPNSLSAGCRSCLCGCDATATGYCDSECWARATCTLQHCASADFGSAAGRDCMEQNCSVKLLPPSVFEASLDAAPCAIACQPQCSF